MDEVFQRYNILKISIEFLAVENLASVYALSYLLTKYSNAAIGKQTITW